METEIESTIFTTEEPVNLDKYQGVSPQRKVITILQYMLEN